jgi:CheY-like chemotaxis protein
MLRRLIGEDVELVTVFDQKVPPILADAGQLEQVVMNLVVNARDAMPHGGRLLIETGRALVDEKTASAHPDVTPGHYAVLAVRDTGQGMTPEVQAQIFEPFFTTKELGKGTGLGLATVHGVVRQTGGHILVHSEPGHGSAFEVYLPAVLGERPEDPIAPMEEAPRGTETILLVEDEVMLRTLIRQQLERRGYSVLEASTAADALALAGSHDPPIELLLTDVVMPEMSGFEVAAQVEARRPETRVLYITGYSERAVDDGLGEREDILPKPFTIDELARRVRDVLDAKA